MTPLTRPAESGTRLVQFVSLRKSRWVRAANAIPASSRSTPTTPSEISWRTLWVWLREHGSRWIRQYPICFSSHSAQGKSPLLDIREKWGTPVLDTTPSREYAVGPWIEERFSKAQQLRLQHSRFRIWQT